MSVRRTPVRAWTELWHGGDYFTVPNRLVDHLAELGMDAIDFLIVCIIRSHQYGYDLLPWPSYGTISERTGLEKGHIGHRIRALKDEDRPGGPLIEVEVSGRKRIYTFNGLERRLLAFEPRHKGGSPTTNKVAPQPPNKTTVPTGPNKTTIPTGFSKKYDGSVNAKNGHVEGRCGLCGYPLDPEAIASGHRNCTACQEDWDAQVKAHMPGVAA